MKFQSINQIIEEFSLTDDTRDELKKRLKSKLKNLHPDKNGGEFKSSEEKILYEKINSALEYLKKPTDIVTRDEITSLTRAIKDLTVVRDNTKQETVLTEKIDSSIKEYSSAHLFPKISSTSITGLLSILWLFPKTISEHEVLSRLIDTSSNLFTIFWILSVIVTGYIWSFLKFIERKNKQLKNNLKLETTQSKLFNQFINQHLLFNEDKFKDGIIKFKKDDLLEFISGYNFRTKEYVYKHKRRISPFDLFLGTSRLDNELVQSLCDLIINKSIAKGIIEIDKQKTFTDIYIMKMDDETKKHYRQHAI